MLWKLQKFVTVHSDCWTSAAVTAVTGSLLGDSYRHCEGYDSCPDCRHSDKGSCIQNNAEKYLAAQLPSLITLQLLDGPISQMDCLDHSSNAPQLTCISHRHSMLPAQNRGLPLRTQNIVQQVQPGYFLTFSWVINTHLKCTLLTLKDLSSTFHPSFSGDNSAQPVSDSGF